MGNNDFFEFARKEKIHFNVDEHKYVVAKLFDLPPFSDEIFALIKDKDEITVIARKELRLKTMAEEKFFRLITFNIIFPFNLSGFISFISSLFAQEKIPLLVISAYSTDHLLVKEEYLDKAIEVLTRNGITSS